MSDVNDLIAANLVEKDNMKVDLSRADSDVVQYNFFRKESVCLKVAEIKCTIIEINDSFILGHPDNSKLDVTLSGDRRTSFTSFVLTTNI